MLLSVHTVHGQMLSLCLAVYQFFSQLFLSLFSPHSPQPLLRNSFLCSITFENCQNSIFVAETHVHTKVSSATKQHMFGI